MDKGLPNGKANWRCDRGEIHCCTHPVGIGDDRNLGGHHAKIKAADDRMTSLKLRQLAGVQR
ncbi:hypothetical protein JNB88_32975 [Rhizobium cauense]|uniref:hypothetical protein n=1 Tax=Rhizobium cauense TaxID=1166683 RepID=UPI001C6F20B0|nr:hypothetical protein [Rhizobium cauense]MBW9118412.1 hypothetical protein [Rhizobium cauense]